MSCDCFTSPKPDSKLDVGIALSMGGSVAMVTAPKENGERRQEKREEEKGRRKVSLLSF